MQSKGANASLTILLVRLGGRSSDRVSEVVGLLLEQQGLKNIELRKLTLPYAADTNLSALAAAVSAFVTTHPITTDYALYAEFNGTHETGLNELRAVVVDQTGAVVWTNLQTAQDLKHQNIGREPIEFCSLLAQQLGPQLGLNQETAKAATPGKIAALMDQRSGLPPESERAPLPERQKNLKASAPKATVVIFPVRIADQMDGASATNLAKLINDAGLCKAAPATQPLLLKASQADPNEMKVLWDLAREFRDYARKNPTDADYTLYADYAFNPNQWEQGFVHFILCDRHGEWVIVDMQNSHHPDYQCVKPVSKLRCDKLLVKRLAGYLQ